MNSGFAIVRGSSQFGCVLQIELLQKEIEQLRDANVILERQTVFGKASELDEDHDAETARYSARASAHEKRAEMVSRKVQQELQALRKENAELKKKERTFTLHQKGFGKLRWTANSSWGRCLTTTHLLFVHIWHFLVNTEDASKKIGK
eukprot:COSAG02_NODE_33591_length_497_cov_10.847315_1_plen_147_part_10